MALVRRLLHFPANENTFKKVALEVEWAVENKFNVKLSVALGSSSSSLY